MFLDNYYDDIMDTDVTDFSNCKNKVALYNKRVQDVKEYLGIVNSFVAYHTEGREKEKVVVERWEKKMEQYLDVYKKAGEAGNSRDELAAGRKYAELRSKYSIIRAGLEDHEASLTLLEKAHEKLLKDAELLKEMENTIKNDYTGDPKTVSDNLDEIQSKKKEPKFTPFTNVIINM